MTDSLITKGPWKAHWNQTLDGWQVNASTGLVCEVFYVTEQGAADARLIAAAPKLLEALREISEMYVYSPEGGHEEVADCVRIARAAIKEATE